MIPLSNNKKGIRTLDVEIKLVQMEKFVDDFDDAMKKDIREKLKQALLILVPFGIAFTGYCIFNSTLLLTIGLGIIAIGTVVRIIVDFKKDVVDFKKEIEEIHNNANNKSLKRNKKGEKDLEQILDEGITKNEGEDFYTEDYRMFLETETEDDIKYGEALEQQQNQQGLSQHNPNITLIHNEDYFLDKNEIKAGVSLKKQTSESQPNIKLITNKKDFLDKDETMIQIVGEIDAYCKTYNIPEIIITNNDWDIFFDILYRVFVKKRLENKFYNAMSELLRLTFAKSLLYETNRISINDFIDSLHCLDSFQFDEKEISIIQKEILSEIKPSKNIDISDIIEAKSRKK